MKKMVVAILLAWTSKAGFSGASGAYGVSPELIANVSMLLATFYEVDCVQIFRSEYLPFAKLEEIHRMWKRLAVVESKITTGIYTYRRYLRKKAERPKKVSCYRSLKIMSDDEESRAGYAEFSRMFSIRDAIWVLYADSLSSLRFFQDARVVFDDVIIIAETKSEELILFHEVYKISDKLMYDRRSDLEGISLRTGSVHNWPSSYYSDGKWQGFLVEIWKEIQSLINCTSVAVEAGDVVGMKMANGSWNGMVGMALRNELDIILSELVIDKDRSRALDFFHPIVKSRFQIYTRHLGYGWQWASILKPFDASVWSAAVAWVLVATFFWTLIHRACVLHDLGSMDFGNVSPFSSFFFVMHALSQQGYHHSPNSYACRILFFVSYAVPSVLIPSYSASLVSSLGQKVYLKSFDSLQEMVEDGGYRLMLKENSAQHAFFINSKDEFFKLAYEKLVKPTPERMKKLGLKESLKELCHLDNYAVMGVEDMVESRLTFSKSLDCPVVHLSHPVSTVYLTMAASKGNPYWGLINYQLGKLLNVGVVERLKREAVPLGHTAAFLEEPVIEVGMRQVISAFLFMWCFIAASVVLLILEALWSCTRTFKSAPKRKKRFRDPGRRFALEMKLQKHIKMQTQTAYFSNFIIKK